MMSSALRTSCAPVPEVSTSMYTAWLWLRWSVHADTPASSSDATSNRLIMIAPVLPESRATAGGPRRRRLAVSHRLDHALDEQRQHDRDVVQGSKHFEQLPNEIPENAQDERQHAHEHHDRRSADRAQRINEGLERDPHESQGKGQEETENHLRRGRDEPEQGIGRRRLRGC